jgi:hypothetical protein
MIAIAQSDEDAVGMEVGQRKSFVSEIGGWQLTRLHSSDGSS